MQDNDYWVLKSLARILIRKGVISYEDIGLEVENLERIGVHEAAHNLSILALEAGSMSASEFEADYRRRQMVERTAQLDKLRQADDGKPPT